MSTMLIAQNETRESEVEEWRDVVGAGNILQVSNFGRIKRIGRFGCVSRKPHKIWAPPSPKNRVWVNGRGSIDIVVLVLESFVGPMPEGMECCHNDDNRANNKLSNLRWDTHSNNVKDGYRNEELRSKKRWRKRFAI